MGDPRKTDDLQMAQHAVEADCQVDRLVLFGESVTQIGNLEGQGNIGQFGQIARQQPRPAPPESRLCRSRAHGYGKSRGHARGSPDAAARCPGRNRHRGCGSRCGPRRAAPPACRRAHPTGSGRHRCVARRRRRAYADRHPHRRHSPRRPDYRFRRHPVADWPGSGARPATAVGIGQHPDARVNHDWTRPSNSNRVRHQNRCARAAMIECRKARSFGTAGNRPPRKPSGSRTTQSPRVFLPTSKSGRPKMSQDLLHGRVTPKDGVSTDVKLAP